MKQQIKVLPPKGLNMAVFLLELLLMFHYFRGSEQVDAFNRLKAEEKLEGKEV